MNNEERPLIIKRKKVSGGDGHHGGAWKVAYADFVTAMMAFFMLMWLLNATTEKQRKGLADYFAPTIAVARVSGGGDGAFGGDSLFVETKLPNSGEGGAIELPPNEVDPNGGIALADQGKESETEALEQLATGIVGKGGDSLIEDLIQDHVVAEVTDEGLRIEIFDLENGPLFDPKSNEPTSILVAIAGVVSEALSAVTNDIAVQSHTSAFPLALVNNPAWEITSDRAQQARILLEGDGTDPLRIRRITGFGQSTPLLDNPMAPRNSRLEIIVLREGR